MKNKARFYITREDQVQLYVKKEENIEKSYISQVLEEISIFVILIDDFYEFALISNYILWDFLFGRKKIHKKLL